AVYLDDDTMLLSATAVSNRPKEQFDFFPLTIDVEERMYAAGRIPGSFFRREGRPGTDAVLAARLTDRPLRPAFVKGLRNEVQVVLTVLSNGPDDAYDVVGINGASASTQISGLPFSGPIGAVRIALMPTAQGGQWVAFPTFSQLDEAVFSMVVAGRIVADGQGGQDVAIMMVEAEATDNSWSLVKDQGAIAPTEEIVAEGIEASKVFVRTLCEAQQDLAAAAAKPVGEFPLFLDYQADAYEIVSGAATDRLREVMSIASKQEREERTEELLATVTEELAGEGMPMAEREKEVTGAYRALSKQVVRE